MPSSKRPSNSSEPSSTPFAIAGGENATLKRTLADPELEKAAISWVSLACKLQRYWDWARTDTVPDVVDLVLTSRLLKGV